MTAPANSILEPCLVDLLRTCEHPLSLTLRVEYVFGKARRGSHGNVVDGLQEQTCTSEGGVSDNESCQPGRKEKESPVQQSAPARLILSDSHLQIQAIFAEHLHTQYDLLHLNPGDVIDVHRLEVRSAPRLNGQGRVVYLSIQECELVSAGSPLKVTQAGRKEEEAQLELGAEGSRILYERGDDEMSPKKKLSREEGQQSVKGEYRSWSRKRDRKPTPGALGKSTSPQKKAHAIPEDNSDDDDGGFDTLAVSQSQVEERRKTLRTMQQTPAVERKSNNRVGLVEEYSQADTQQSLPISPPRKPVRDEHAEDTKQAKEKGRLSEDTVAYPAFPELQDAALPALRVQPPAQQQVASPESSTTPSVITLSALLAAPTQKPHHCTPLFGVISWISPSIIYRPNTPYPPKRHLKIHDPSISTRVSGITVAVFIDAARFLPAVGSVALLRGLVMNRVRNGEDVILNRYPLKPGSQVGGKDGLEDGFGAGERAEDEWFVGDENRLVEMGYDVKGMKTWWEERSAAGKEKSS